MAGVKPSTVAQADALPAESAVIKEAIEPEGKPAFVMAGMTFAGMVFARRLARTVVKILKR